MLYLNIGCTTYLIGFGYDLSDTQDGLSVGEMGFIFCGKHPLLMTRIRVSDPEPQGPSSFNN